MKKDQLETRPPEDEEAPEIFNVVKDINGNQFNRRDFIEKAMVTSAAVTVVAAGCVSPTASPQQVQEAIVETQAQSTVAAVRQATSTSTPKPTHTPTKTKVPPTATITSSPTPAGITSKVTGDNINFRSGPGTYYPPITRLPRGTEILLTGRLADSSWVAVSLADPNKPGSVVPGWIKTTLVDTAGKDIQSLPVISDIPPTPTPLPGRVGKTGAGQNGVDYQYTDAYGNVYTYTMPCGSALPDGATCLCNCVTVPSNCSCVEHTDQTYCTCDSVHYWYPN